MTPSALASWLEATRIGTWVRDSPWGFSIMVAIHLLSLGVSVGLLLWFDLRLIGVGITALRISHVYRRLMPLVLPAFVLTFASGFCLLLGYATSAEGNPYAWLKAAAIVGAALNAAFYHAVTERGAWRWDADALPPPAARVAGLVSMLLWVTVIAAGRLMSYTMF